MIIQDTIIQEKTYTDDHEEVVEEAKADEGDSVVDSH